MNDFDRENFSARWTGYLKPPVTGDYQFGAYGYDQYKVYLGDSLITGISSEHEPKLSYKKVVFEAGKTYKIEVQYASSKSAPHIQLKWEIPNQNLQAKALEVCKEADVVVMCMGLSSHLEGEEMKELAVEGFYRGDRTKLSLPDNQLALMKAVKALGKPMVLVLVNGSAVAVNWEQENIPAIIEAWYGGQEGGTAIADVLAGDYNPAGRLPLTYYKSETDLPDFSNYNMAGRTYRYFKGKPLYEFGYGLSYTTFAYSNVKVADKAVITSPVTISATVTNTGKWDGDEVVQLYVANESKEDSAAIRTLKGYRRIFLKRGETKTINFNLTASDFSVINEEGRRVTKPGYFTIAVGGGQPSVQNMAEKKAVVKRIELTGKKIQLAH